MSIEGVDYSFSPPSVSSLVANGKKFAIRYGGPGTSGKWLKASEYQALTAVGIEVVANAEGSANGLQGFSAGKSWATSALNYFRGIGMPSNRPIYFSADWDVQSNQWPAVREALTGAASVVGLGNVGVYGSRNVIKWARADGVAVWFWQTYAWSYGEWVPGTHLQQYKNGVAMGGGQVDLNRAMTADYGQWGFGGAVADPTVTRQWPAWMPAGHYFGLKNGPDESHGGFFGVDIPEVKAIQQRLQALGFAPSTAGWADGDYGEATASAVRQWQANQYPASQHAGSGQIWPDDWKVLFQVPVVVPPPPVVTPPPVVCNCLTEAQVVAAVKKALKEGTD